MLNETIVCEGYANALTRYPFRQEYMDRFRACERQARAQGKGLWSEGLTGQVAPASSTRATASATEGAIKGNRRSKIYHLSSCPGYDRVSAGNMVTFPSETAATRAGYRKAKNCP